MVAFSRNKIPPQQKIRSSQLKKILKKFAVISELNPILKTSNAVTKIFDIIAQKKLRQNFFKKLSAKIFLAVQKLFFLNFSRAEIIM